MSTARIRRWPSRRSSVTRWPPMKPPAPATTTSASLSRSLISVLSSVRVGCTQRSHFEIARLTNHENRPMFDLFEDAADVQTQDAEAHQHEAAQKELTDHETRPADRQQTDARGEISIDREHRG